MGTDQDKGGARITRQVESSFNRTTTWAFLVLCSLLISSVFSIVIVAENGVIYYVGESSPTAFQEALIEEWKELPVVSLFYDGPDELKGIVENALNSSGILTGVGTPLFVLVREKDGYVAISLSFEGKRLDDFEDPVEIEDLEKWIEKAVGEIFGKIEKPPYGFVVVWGNGTLDTRLEKVKRPVVFVKKVGKYFVDMGGERFELEEGFHVINGNLVYVGKNMVVSEDAVRFVEGVEMVYPDGSFYENGRLTRPDGASILLGRMPIDVWRDFVVTRSGVYRNGRVYRTFEDTVVDSFCGVLLLSDGSVADVGGTWKMEVSCVPIEWVFRDGGIHILDLCGNLVFFDVRKRKVEELGKYPGAYGFDFLEGETVVGTRNGVVRNGEIVKAENFCVEGEKLITKGDLVRTHIGLCLMKKKDGYEVSGVKGKYYRIFPDYVVLGGERGVWVVKSPGKDSTFCW